MPDDDDDDFQTLTNLLSTDKGKSWLTEQLKGLGLELKAPPKPGEPPPGPSLDPVAAFFRDQASETAKANSKLSERLEAILDVLTPEQRTLLKSARSAPPADPSGRRNNEPPPAKKKFLGALKGL